MINIEALKKEYGGKTVLDIPALDISDGERCALIGANGSGKTTLLRILAGQLSQDSGSVRLGGLSVRDIGYLPQAPYAFDISVLSNVMLAAGKGSSARAQAREAMEKVGISHLESKRGSRLSGGEAQRMALARLIVRPWRLLLLDEPTGSVDIAATDAIEDALLQYLRENGCTLIFSTHMPAQAARLASRTVMLDSGRVAEDGETASVLHSPQSEAAKQFLRHWSV